MSKINVQMYSFADGAGREEKENFRLAKELGFDGCELFAANFQIPAEELKAYMDELGLEAVGMHAPGADAVISMIPYAKTLGMKYIGIGMENMYDDDQVHAFARRLNEMGEVCAKEGLKLYYHNHTQEFLPCDDKYVMDVLMDETNPEYVCFELDAGWCAAAGVDPMEYVIQHAGRIKMIHIKESSRAIGPQKPIPHIKDENGKPALTEEMKKVFAMQQEINCKAGDGIVDWAELKKIADQHGVEAYIVERELTLASNRIETLREDIAYYRSIL